MSGDYSQRGNNIAGLTGFDLLATLPVTFGFLPELFEFFEGGVFQFFAAFGHFLLDILEPLDEFVVGSAKGFFRVDLFEFGDIDQHE